MVSSVLGMMGPRAHAALQPRDRFEDLGSRRSRTGVTADSFEVWRAAWWVRIARRSQPGALPSFEALRRAVAGRDKDDPLPVDDRALPRAVDAMLAYHGDVKDVFFGNVMDGMWRLRGIGEQMEIQFAPNRCAPRSAAPNGRTECVFCESPDPIRRGIRWRDVVVIPNRYPYFPLSFRHVVLAAADHVGQHVSADVLQSMIDYQRSVGRGQPLTLFFNGKAGNSQFHHHWQGCRESPPLARVLDSGDLPTRTWLKTDSGVIQSFDRQNLRGILVQGGRRFVGSWGARLAADLEKDPAVAGKYHLVLLPPSGNDVRLVLIARRNGRLVSTEPGLEGGAVGALGCVGLLTCPWAGVPRGMTPEQLAGSMTRFVRDSTVPAEELAWLPGRLAEASVRQGSRAIASDSEIGRRPGGMRLPAFSGQRSAVSRRARADA